MQRANHNGSILITIIVAMVLISVMGAGIYSLTKSSTFTGLLTNNNDQAYQLAQAGIRYKIKNLSDTNAIGDFLMPDNNHKFNIAYNDTTKIITSTGIVNENSFFEARRVITYDIHDYWKLSDTAADGTITLGPDTKPSGTAGAIVVNPDGTIKLPGNNNQDSSGSVWYQGSSSAGNCNSGACDFNYGLRVYFEFTPKEDSDGGSTTYGDGFTFTVMSAINNTRDRSGGAPPSISSGELMGYAGPGNTTDGLGLKPPKMALEFDTYPNAVGDICVSSSRNDNNGGTPASFLNHMAILFWGENVPAGGSCGTYDRNSYDDNRHQSGSGDTSTVSAGPVNSYFGYAGGGYLSGYHEGTKGAATSNCASSPATTCNWIEDGHPYSVRMEITRKTSGTSGLYELKAWIYRNTELPTSLTQYKDLTNPYNASVPTIIRTVTLTQSYHEALNQIFLGFTEGTGGATQNTLISNFKFFFPQTPTCSATINPTSLAAANSGATSQTVTITPGAGCAWTAASNNGWITITGPASGTGPGTVTYDVAANTGPARTGTMTIAGQTFTVTQNDGCTYAISPTSATPGSGAGTGSVGVTSATGCTWTASVTTGGTWLSITSGSPGSGNGTVNYSYTANTGAARTGTITIAGQTFTVTQSAPPPVVTVISPNSGNNNWVRFNVTITGTGFRTGATVTRSAGTGGTFAIDNVVFVSATQITARFRINTSVPIGAQTIRVTNTGGQYGEIQFTVY